MPKSSLGKPRASKPKKTTKAAKEPKVAPQTKKPKKKKGEGILPQPKKKARSLVDQTPATRLRRTFLLFAPWCDQGLGVQAREYVGWLTELGYRVVVFSCKPSKRSGPDAPRRMQASHKEWKDVEVAYAGNTRETVDFVEVVAYAKTQHVTDALMLEIAHRRIFVISAALAAEGIRVYAVPNIEMVRRSELSLIQQMRFHKILCNNEHTRQVLQYFKVSASKLALFPFALHDADAPRAQLHRPGEPIKFLLVGGMNAERRKQASLVMTAFAHAFRAPHSLATLTVLCQGQDVPKTRLRCPYIKVVHKHLSHAEVLGWYAKSHVLVMLSRAEGIGIGFHEALRAGCAIMTFATPMYRELVLPDGNGWLVPAKAEDGTEGARKIGNDDPIVRTHTCDVSTVISALQLIVGQNDVARLQAGARKTFELMYEPGRVLDAYRKTLA